jgi:hypothetical protein
MDIKPEHEITTYIKGDDAVAEGCQILKSNGIMYTFPYQTDIIRKWMEDHHIVSVAAKHVNRNDNMVALCNKKLPSEKNFRNTYGSEGVVITGSIMFCRQIGSTHNPISRKDVMDTLASTHHVCGWPLTTEEKNGQPCVSINRKYRHFPLVERKGSDRRFNLIMQALREAQAMSRVSVLMVPILVGNTVVSPFCLGKIDTLDKQRYGIVIERMKIPNPLMPYNAKKAITDTIAITIVGVDQTNTISELAIAHFDLEDLEMVRCVVRRKGGNIWGDDGIRWQYLFKECF